MHPRAEHRLWAATRRLAGVLILLWLAVGVAGPWFARELNGVTILGFPAGYWMASQGGLLAFLAITVVCIWRMERHEARYDEELAAEDARERPPS